MVLCSIASSDISCFTIRWNNIPQQRHTRCPSLGTSSWVTHRTSSRSGIHRSNRSTIQNEIEPRQGIKSATCTVYPLNPHWTVIVDFSNWDPDKDGKAQEFEKCLEEKMWQGQFRRFLVEKVRPLEGYPRFMFHVPYPARDRMEGRMEGVMYELISDAIYEYTGGGIRTPCYHA